MKLEGHPSMLGMLGKSSKVVVVKLEILSIVGVGNALPAPRKFIVG